jgi:hypothetical protein
VILSLCFTAVLCVLLAFFLSSAEPLEPAVTISDPQVLEKMQADLVRQYQKDEQLFAEKVLLKREWSARQEFLLRRYIDITRRLDHVRAS